MERRGQQLAEMQPLTRNWNELTRAQQVRARHQVHDISDIPNDEYTASWVDVRELITEHTALVEQRDLLVGVLRRTLKAIEVIDFSPCREGSYDSIPWQDIEHALATAAQSHEPQAKGGSEGED